MKSSAYLPLLQFLLFLVMTVLSWLIPRIVSVIDSLRGSVLNKENEDDDGSWLTRWCERVFAFSAVAMLATALQASLLLALVVGLFAFALIIWVQ